MADRSEWLEGQPMLTGYLGIDSIQSFERTGGSRPDIDGSGGSIDQYPVIGGGGQWKLRGDRVALGLEGLMALGGRANGGAFVVGGGGAAVAVSLDMMLVEFYGGPFVSVPLGDRARLYGALGPTMQFVNYHQSATAISRSGSGSGFGLGGYTRAGIELEMSPGSFVGLGVRWYDSSVDLSGSLGDLELETVEAMLTFSVLR